MDFKKLSTFLIAVGVVMLVAGGIIYITNQTAELSPGVYFQSGFESGMGRPGQATEAVRKKERSDRNRDIAQKILIGGGIALIVGISISVSTKT